MPAIYLDNNATTRIDPRIARRMLDLHSLGLANPASQHGPGRAALGYLEDAKNELLDLIDAPNSGTGSAQVILTSGGTEANNLAIRGYASNSTGIVVVVATEHPSIVDPARALGPERCRILPVDAGGQCDLEVLHAWLRQEGAKIKLVSVMLGNNETGVLQDLKSVCQLCLQFGVPVHSDAVQAAGKVDISMSQLGLSALTLTAHKIHGPVGVGALVLLEGQKLEPMLLGGGQQLGMRPGTEPVIPAVALTAAIRLASEARQQGHYDKVAELRDRFENALASLEPIEIVALQQSRLPHVSNIAFCGIDRQQLHMALDLAGIACSTGSACASGSGRPSPVLSAMGLSESVVSSSIRFSLSRFTTPQEVDLASQTVIRVVRKLRTRSRSAEAQ